MARRRKPKRARSWLPEHAVDANGLTAWARRYITSIGSRGFSQATLRNREIALGRFINWCEARTIIRPEEVTKPILERYRTHLFHYRSAKGGKPLSFSTQALFLVGVKLWFQWLTRQNVLLWNPASELELPRYVRRVPRPALTVEEVESIISQPNVAEPLGLRDRTILEVLYSTAMRRAELASLTVFDFEQGASTLHIRQGKGGRPRFVPVGERCNLWLRKYLDEARPQLAIEPHDGALFLTNMGEPFEVKRLSALVRAYIEQAEVKKAGSCHLFRASAATHMLEHGADVRWIAQLLGHADLATVEVYTRVDISQLARIHALTHPGASLKFSPSARPTEEGIRVAVVERPSSSEQLQATLEVESDEDDEA